jgi:glycopeptidolipid biosynthesis protein
MVHGEATRADCLDYIEQNWPDIRPKSLRDRLAQQQARDN